MYVYTSLNLNIEVIFLNIGNLEKKDGKENFHLILKAAGSFV